MTVSELEEEKEELESTIEIYEEKIRKLQSQNDQYSNELAVERSTSSKHESARTQLERQVKEKISKTFSLSSALDYLGFVGRN